MMLALRRVGRPRTIAAAAAVVAAVGALGLAHVAREHAAGHACSPGGTACGVRSVHAGGAGRGTLAGLPAGEAVVVFTSVGCPACRQMAPVLRAARDQCLESGARVLELDVDSPEGGPLAAALNVTATPTLVLFDGDHREASRLVGLRSIDEVRRALEQSFGVACSGISGASATHG